jgi:hypothetical protein
MKSALTISYNDLIKHAEAQVAWMEKKYPGMKLSGAITAFNADHRLECARTIVRLLKKQKNNPQLSLDELFYKQKN